MIRLIESITDFKTLKDDCNRLADSIQMPLLRYEWLYNCALNLADGEKLFVIILINDKRVRAIAPFVLVKKLFSERLELLGSSLHLEPSGFLYEDEYSLNELLTAVKSMKKSLIISRIKNLFLESYLLSKFIEKNKMLKCNSVGKVPFINTSGTLDEFQDNISADRRSSLRRLKRIAEKNGKLSVEILNPLPGSVDQYLEEVFETEASGWKKKIGTAMTTNKRLGRFFRNYSKEAAESNMLRLCFLRVDGKAIAVQIVIEYFERLWILKTGYDESWSRCSPGILLMNEVINYAFRKKIKTVELLGSNESWLQIWTNNFHNIITYRIYYSTVLRLSDILLTYFSAFRNKMISFKLNKLYKVKGLSNA